MLLYFYCWLLFDWSFGVLDEVVDIVEIVIGQSIEDGFADLITFFQALEFPALKVVSAVYNLSLLYFRILSSS